MEVRADVRRPGKLLYSGTLEQGQRKSFDGKSLQLALAKPQNVVVRLNGNRCRPPERHDVRRDVAKDRPGHLLSRPRAAIVATGSRARPRRAPGPQRAVPRGGGGPARSRAGVDRHRRRRQPTTSSTHSEKRSTPISASSRAGSGRRTTTERSSSSPVSQGARSWSTQSSRRRSAPFRAPIAERLGRPYSDFAAGVLKQATRPEGSVSLGLAGTAPGLVLDLDTTRRRRAPWARRASSSGSGRVRSRPPPCAASSRELPAGRTRAALLRHARVGRGGGVRGCGRRGRRCRGHDLCARVRDPRRPLRRAEAEERVTQRSSRLSERISARYLFGEDERSIAEIVLDLCRARGLTLAHRRVLYRRPGRGEAHVGSGVERGLPRLGGRLRGRREGEELGVPADAARDVRRRLGRGGRRDGPRASASGSASTSPSAVTGVAGPGGAPRRSLSASSSRTRSARTATGRCGPSSRATAR